MTFVRATRNQMIASALFDRTLGTVQFVPNDSSYTTEGELMAKIYRYVIEAEFERVLNEWDKIPSDVKSKEEAK